MLRDRCRASNQLLTVLVFVGGVGFSGLAKAASPAEVLTTYTDAVTIAWRPMGACLEDWDPQLMRYPAPTSYLTGKDGYVRHVYGPADSEAPKYVEAFTYKSFSGRPVAAALAFANWGYRVSWFEQRPNGFVYGGSFLVPALWVRERHSDFGYCYHEVRAGRYTLPVPVKGAFRPGTSYRITVEPLKIVLHEWLDFEDASVCIPSFSPLIPSDITFQPIVILWPKGPKWYYGLSKLSNCEGFAEPQVSSAADMPPLSFNSPPKDLSRFHYEGSDRPGLGQQWDDPWLARVYWWYGQPASRGNGMGGGYWYPVCGVRGYVQGGGDWTSFGAQGPRVMWEAAVTTKPLPFEVVSTFPQNGQRGVKPDVVVEVTLSKPITSLDAAALRWTDGSGQPVEFSAQAREAKLLLQPRKPLSQNTDYHITIPKSALKSGTETLAADFSFSFSTKPPSGGGGGGHGQAQ